MSYVTDPSRPHLGGNIAGGDPGSYYPALWAWLVDRFAVKSVLDVGCAEGRALEEFERLGCVTIGIDGLAQNYRPGLKVIQHDLTEGPCPIHGVDLVWCCEVVEHLEEKCLPNLLDTICCGRVLAMTHGLPQQDGWHHVNCQESSYWIEKMAERGFTVHPDTWESRKLAEHYWERTGLIFVGGGP